MLLSDFGADDNAMVKSNVLARMDGSVPLVTILFSCTNYKTTQKIRQDAMAQASAGRSELLGYSDVNCEIIVDGEKGGLDNSQISVAANTIGESIRFASVTLDISSLYKAGAQAETKEVRVAFGGSNYTTRVLLDAGALATPTVAVTPTPTPDPNPIILKFGDENATVLELQQLLANLYYYTDELNRKFDTNVQVALMNFCKDNKLEFSDALREDVWKVLKSGKAKPAKTPEPTASPTPEPTRDPNLYLAMGDQDAKVYNLQKKLVSLGYMSDRDVSRTYDETTQVALYDFYEVNGLELYDGVPLSVWNLLQSGNALPLPTATPEPTPVVTPEPTRDPAQKFAQGDTGGEVRILQNYLVSHYYMNEKLKTGVFDEATQWAVDEFCNINGIPIYDNGMSTEAWTVLQSGIALAKPTATPEPATPSPTPRDPNLKFVLGESNSDVIKLQNRLVQMYYLGMESVTGEFDQETLIAVVDFCEINRIETMDGMSYVAWTCLMSGNALPKPTATPTPSPTPSPTPVVTVTPMPDFMAIKSDDSNDYVRKYQQKLVEMGYLTDEFTAGVFDDATQAAQDLMCEYNNLTKQIGANVDIQQFVSSSTLKNLNAMGFADKLHVQLTRKFVVAGIEIPLWIPACVALGVFLLMIIVILCMPGKKGKKGAAVTGGTSAAKPAPSSGSSVAMVSEDKPTDDIDTSSDVPTSENINDWQVVLTISFMGSATDHSYSLNDGIPLSIGRGSGSDVLLNANDTQASRRHGELIYRGNQLFYHDCSKKGSIVDGKMINNDECAVRVGTIIEISHHTIRINF